MNCEECGKRPATLHLTKIVNGEKTEYHICEQCASEKGDVFTGFHNFSINNLLSGLLKFDPMQKTDASLPPVSRSVAKLADSRMPSSAKAAASVAAIATPSWAIDSIRCSAVSMAIRSIAAKFRSAQADS